MLTLNPRVTDTQRFRAGAYMRTPSLGESMATALRSCNALARRFQRLQLSHRQLRDAVLAAKLPSYHPAGNTHGVAKDKNHGSRTLRGPGGLLAALHSYPRGHMEASARQGIFEIRRYSGAIGERVRYVCGPSSVCAGQDGKRAPRPQ